MATTWPDASAGMMSRFLFEGTLMGQQIRTSFDYRLDSISGTPEPINQVITGFLADTQFTSLRTAFLACVPSDYSLDTISWQIYKNPVVYARQRVLQGLLGGNTPAFVANTQATIVRRPLLGTRYGVGAIRVPMPMDSTNADQGELTQDAKDLLQALADLMDDTIIHIAGGATTYHWDPVVIRKATPFPGFTDVFATFVQPNARVLRRRTARLGI